MFDFLRHKKRNSLLNEAAEIAASRATTWIGGAAGASQLPVGVGLPNLFNFELRECPRNRLDHIYGSRDKDIPKRTFKILACKKCGLMTLYYRYWDQIQVPAAPAPPPSYFISSYFQALPHPPYPIYPHPYDHQHGLG
jgi:hypothetical protein